MNKIDDIKTQHNSNNENPLMIALYQLFNPAGSTKQKRLVIDFERLEQIEKENYEKWKEQNRQYMIKFNQKQK